MSYRKLLEVTMLTIFMLFVLLFLLFVASQGAYAAKVPDNSPDYKYSILKNGNASSAFFNDVATPCKIITWGTQTYTYGNGGQAENVWDCLANGQWQGNVIAVPRKENDVIIVSVIILSFCLGFIAGQHR